MTSIVAILTSPKLHLASLKPNIWLYSFFTNYLLYLLFAAFANDEEVPDKEKPKSFFMRMKCTLVRRGGAYTKSSGFKVGMCRMYIVHLAIDN